MSHIPHRTKQEQKLRRRLTDTNPLILLIKKIVVDNVLKV